MLFFLTTQPLLISGAILVGLTTVLAMLGPWIVRRFVALDRLTTNNEIAGFKFATIGVLYAVLLAGRNSASRNHGGEGGRRRSHHLSAFARPRRQARRHPPRCHEQLSRGRAGRRWIAALRAEARRFARHSMRCTARC
jgi:hypothetical protein